MNKCLNPQHIPVEKSVYTPEHVNFRTKICRHWLKGYCNRGEHCNFAHGYVQVQKTLNKRKKQDSPVSVATTTYEMKWGEETQYNPLKELIDDYEIIRHDDVPSDVQTEAINVVKRTAYEYSDNIESCVI